WSERDGVPLITIDFPGMQPRHTLFASFVGIATALKNSGLAEDVTDDLRRVADVLDHVVPTQEAEAKQLAATLKGKTSVYTSGSLLSFAAKNFKIQTNENVKTPAFWNEFPELNHNEMVGFTHPQAPFHVVMLRDPSDHPRIKARMDVTTELYRQWGVEVTSVAVQGETLLEKLFYAVSFGMWTTYFLAEAYGIDPVPVEGVENFKKRLVEVAGEAV
ncbi:MAG: SIS domain-containing protein, partial [Candidatus Andersenbacteria bacterium]